MMNILELKNLALAFNGTTIINDLSLDFWKGYIHAVVGPNGAGKSSLAFTIMGLEGYRERTRGEILFQGETINGLDVYQRARRGITLAWQEPARFEGLTVEKFLRAAARDKSEKALRRALEDVAIDPDQYLSRAVDKTLSGGERKKIELASLLLMRPKLVMLDEPDSGIDVASLENIFEALQQFKKFDSTVILITHSPTVLKHAEHAFLICCGRLIDKGDPDKIDRYFEDKCIPCDHKNEPEDNLLVEE